MKKDSLKIAVCTILSAVIMASVGMLAGCSNTSTAVVPDVLGMPQEDAEQTLADAGFTMAVTRSRFSDRNPEGCVDSMVTKANQELEKGSEVKVITSQGRGVQVPNMWVLTGAEAANLLTKVGLTPVIVEEYSDDVEVGNVISYTDSGQTLSPGSEVTLTVSKGPEA